MSKYIRGDVCRENAVKELEEGLEQGETRAIAWAILDLADAVRQNDVGSMLERAAAIVAVGVQDAANDVKASVEVSNLSHSGPIDVRSVS